MLKWTVTVAAMAGCGQEPTVSYSSDLLPIFTEECAGCHTLDWNRPEGQLRFGNCLSLFEGGRVDPQPLSIRPGSPNRSYLVQLLRGDGCGNPPSMPPDGEPFFADRRPEDFDLIRTWINEGALDN